MTNSRVTRVQPVFQWLIEHGGDAWPAQLLSLATDFLAPPAASGALAAVQLDPETQVAATPTRLAWMLRNAALLVPRDGRRWQELAARVADPVAFQQTLDKLDTGQASGIPPRMRLEGDTHADCLIECEVLLIWIEGKRFDWLSPSIDWDVTRDQLARNVEAAWTVAHAAGKDFRLLICHEHPLKHHEQSLLHGYRTGTWSAGWPHLTREQRNHLAQRIGTVTWGQIAAHWPALQALPELADLAIPGVGGGQ